MRGDYILAGVSLLVTATISGGLINGWGPIHSMLQNERNCKGKCSPEIEDEFQAIFQSGFIALSVTSTLFGLAVDRFGPRVTVLCGISMSVVGNILFALSDWDKFNAFSWGYALIGGGGIAPFLCHFNFANYFENGLKYVTAVNTMFNLAGVVYLLISAFEFPRREFFLVYAGICAAFGIAAAFLYPDKVAQRNSVYNYPRINCFSTNDAESETEKQDLIKKDSELQNYWSKIKPDMFSRPFILLVVWYSLNLLITGWVSSTLPDILNRFPYNKDLYTNYLLPIISNLTFLFSSLSGILIQRYGCGLLTLLSSIFTTLELLSCIAPKSFTIHFQILSLILCALQKGCLFNTFFVFIGMHFDISINGALIGISTICAAIIGTFSYALSPLTQFTFSGSYTYTNIVLVVITLPMYMLPVHLYKLNK